MVIAANPDSGRVGYNNSFAADLPAPLRDHCLRQQRSTVQGAGLERPAIDGYLSRRVVGRVAQR